MKVLITGASGNLGADLAAALARAGYTVYCLIHRELRLRLNNGAVLDMAECDFSSAGPGDIVAIKGDICAAQLGLSDQIAAWIAHSIDIVVHAAALTEFGLEQARYENVNIGGTRNVIDFIEAADRPIILVHVSTAYVSGYWRGRFDVSDLDGGQDFGNAYEWSKLAAEKIVQRFVEDGGQAIVLRPSIIVGDSSEGLIRDFRLLYPVLKIVGEGKVASIAGYYDARLDLVPIDYVVAAATWIIVNREKFIGGTIHLVSGDPITLRDACEVMAEFPSMCVPKVIPPTSFDLKRLSVREQTYYKRVVSLFQAYFLRTVAFAPSHLCSDLPPIPDRRKILRQMISYGQRVGYFGPADARSMRQAQPDAV